MEELLIAGLLVQVLIMWALSAPGVIPEEVSALEKKLEAMAAAPTDNAVVSGFENLMRYGVDTARGAGK